MEINAAPYIGLLGAIIMWFGLIFTLLVLKGLIVQGANMAIAEWLKMGGDGSQERICRWLGDTKQIMQQLKQIEETQQK